MRTLTRPIDLPAPPEEEGAWDCPACEAGDDLMDEAP